MLERTHHGIPPSGVVRATNPKDDEGGDAVRGRLKKALAFLHDDSIPNVRKFLARSDMTSDLEIMHDPVSVSNAAYFTVEFSRFDLDSDGSEPAKEQVGRHYVLLPYKNIEKHSMGVVLVISTDHSAGILDHDSLPGPRELVAYGRYARNDCSGEILAISDLCRENSNETKLICWVSMPDCSQTSMLFECDKRLFESGHFFESVGLSVMSQKMKLSACRPCHLAKRHSTARSLCHCTAKLKLPQHERDFSLNYNNFAVQGGMTSGTTSVLSPYEMSKKFVFAANDRSVCHVTMGKNMSLVHRSIEIGAAAIRAIFTRLVRVTNPARSSTFLPNTYQVNLGDMLTPNLLVQTIEGPTCPQVVGNASISGAFDPSVIHAHHASQILALPSVATSEGKILRGSAVGVNLGLEKALKRKMSNRASAARSNARRKQRFDDLTRDLENAKKRVTELNVRKQLLEDENLFLRQMQASLIDRSIYDLVIPSYPMF